MDNLNDQTLSDESLKDDFFSSHTHVIDTFAREAKEEIYGREFYIPRHYNKNMLAILPVNVNKCFIYWEVTQGLMELKKNGHAVRPGFVLKICEKLHDGESEFARVSTNDMTGNQYFLYYMPGKTIFASIGMLDVHGNFIEIIRSKMFSMPSDQITQTTDELWMSKTEDWMELIKASTVHYSHAKSSASYVHEMELLKNYRKLHVFMDTFSITGVPSSHEFTGFLGGSSEMSGSSGLYGSNHLFGSNHLLSNKGE